MRAPAQARARGRDWPPIVRFLMAFGGLLAVAIGLAVVSSSAEPSAGSEAPSAAADSFSTEPATRPLR